MSEGRSERPPPPGRCRDSGLSWERHIRARVTVLSFEVLAFLDAVDFDAAGPIARAESNSKAPVNRALCFEALAHYYIFVV